MTGIIDFRTVLEDPDGNNITPSNPLPVSVNSTEETPVYVAPSNIVGKFRDTFEDFTPGVDWNLSQDTNDIVQLDGNAVSASYLVISKDPLSVGGVSTIETIGTYAFPFEVAVGVSMSQRVTGQELSVETVSDDAPLPPYNEVSISSIQQATTTLTVTTTTPHDLVPGKRIGIYGVTADSRLNYPSLVVATITSATTFTATAGPGGTISTVNSGPHTNQGAVYFRSALGYAQDGISQIFENPTAGNASLYSRASSGDALPTGTVNGNHSLTTASTVASQPVVSPYTYSFLPTSEFRFILQADRAQWLDAAIDSTAAPTARLLRTQVIPDPRKKYKLRFRFTNNKGLTTPNAKIVSAVKSGSTTATITTDTAHGLTTGSYIVIYGIGDTTNFANLTTATAVASVINSTQFTIAFGASATATSAGGMVARVDGNNIPSAFTTTAALQASSTSTELTLIGSASWPWLIGDYVNVYGLRNRATGDDMGFDGTYKVVNVATSTLVLSPIGSTVLPSPISLTNTGGTVLKRTDMRLSFVRIFDYLRERVEVQPNGAAAASVPITGTVAVSSGTVSTANLAINNFVGDITSAAITSTATSGTITPASSALANEFNVIVTAVSGTNPTLDVVVQESDDSGTNWFDVYHFPRINATGQYRSPQIPMTGNRVRYVRTVGGTSPSFTNAVNRIQSHTSFPVQRQFIAYAANINVNSLNATSPVYFTEGCAELNVIVSMGAVTTTAPVLVVEQSMDNANWIQAGADITTVASTNILLQVSNILGRFTRIRVKTAGSGATLNAIWVKGVGK